LVIEDTKYPQWSANADIPPLALVDRVPMVVRDRVIGDRGDKVARFLPDSDANTVSAMARQAAIAVEMPGCCVLGTTCA
jgi:hypothetical protein